ncbi:hypothetical protein FHL15_010757 [Xylaria flabelliformis]|uniref:Uncharacterized protein n=1 Tax=Xylaria flabelliformis TaxID=2512241 RepID=A0A553HK41_9PEZI|nr:hypothetical protein FHL15_010757 [Xylaria flabelliformis]
MPILRSLPPWPNPQESMAREIPSSRVGNRMVWWPQGPALEIFEKFILPEIKNILAVVELGHAELFIRLYMIGRKPESANPIVMICCTNSKARDVAEATIRETGLLDAHRGFGLGRAALPLEHPAPVRRLSPDKQRRDMSTGSGKPDPTNIPSLLSPSEITIFGLPIHTQPSRTHWSSMNTSTMNDSLPFIINALPSSTESKMSGSSPIVFASSIEPLIGRRVFASTNVDHASHPYATAGVVIQVGESYYQLTVGHLFEEITEISDEEESQMSLDEFHFDGQSDDDGQDSDYETEIMGRGSASPEEEALSSSNGSANEHITRHYTGHTNVSSKILGEIWRQEDLKKSSRSRNKLPAISEKGPQRQHGSGDISTLFQRTQSEGGANSKALANPGLRLPVGCLPRGKSFQTPIDYAIITVSRNYIENLGWKINYIEQVRQRVKDVAEVGHEERNIIVATYSRIIKGVLIPGKVAYRNRRAQFERLVQVELNSEVFEGESGSPVLDESTGSLCGHIVMGVPGTKMAYIAQAIDIFRDIEAGLGKPAKIVMEVNRRIMKTPTSRSRVQLKPPITSEESIRNMLKINSWGDISNR